MGNVKKIGNTVAAPFTFPTGDTTVVGGLVSKIWAPIMTNAFDNTNEFTARYYHKSTLQILGIDFVYNLEPGMEYASRMEFWNLERTGVGVQTPAVTLYWKDAITSDIANDGSSYDIGALADLTVAHWNGTSWDNMGGVASGVFPIGQISTTVPFTSYSPITLASKAKKNTLPVELLNFTALPNGKVVDLNWATATEKNNDFFTVERSKDAVNLEDISTIKGSGNSSSIISYSDKDINPYDGISYYRLKQTDFDGKFSYSNIVSVEFEPENSRMLDLTVFPNPAKNGNPIYLKFDGVETAKEILVVVKDIVGKEWYSKVVITSETDNSVFAIDHYNNIAPGVYIVIGTSDDGIYYKKIVIE